ncbi:MAG: hypothetical protein PHP28_12605 [Actinomycetota bacterium]|nr:hypothetical protein [Actinomycetota bacterium]MDD5668239.1 hypothetical protein [Actinomycetota bacterium]
MTEKYKSGTFCVDIQCPRHKDLESLEGDAYLEKKREHCKDCTAWEFFIWLDKRGYRIIKVLDQISAKELAARIKGIDPVTVKDLTIDEIMCL